MAMQFLRDGAASGVLKFFLMGLLVLAVGGLVMMDVGGFFRGGVGRTDVAKIGGEKISAQSFDRTVQRTTRRIGMTPQEAYKLGHINEILYSNIRGNIMIQSAGDLGVQISQDRLAREVAKIIKPMVQDGQTPQNVLNTLLMQQGMSEQDFINSMRRETAAGILRSALESGFAVLPEGLSEDFYAFQNETRTVDLVVFPDKDFKVVKEPTEDQLMLLYSAMKEGYAEPERRTLVLAALDVDNIQNTIEISDTELQAAYEDNIEAYMVSEQRTLEQAVLKSELEASDVLERVQKGESLKSAAEAVTGETNAYLGEQTFEEDGLLAEIKEAAFQGEERLLDKPIKTALGWHVIRVKDIKTPTTKPLSEVKDALKRELLQVKLADRLYDVAGEIDDQLGGGAPLDQVAKEMNLKTYEIKDVDTFGLTPDKEDALDNFAEDREFILQTAFDLFEGEASPVVEMNDGSFMTIYVAEVKEKSYPLFEDIKPRIVEKWNNDQRRVDNKQHVELLAAKNDTSLDEIAKSKGKSIQTIRNIKRNGVPAAPITPQALNLIFDTAVGKTVQINVDGGTAIAQIKSASLPDSIDENALKTVKSNIREGIQSEAQLGFIRNQQKKYGVAINEKLLDQMYSPKDVQQSGGLY